MALFQGSNSDLSAMNCFHGSHPYRPCSDQNTSFSGFHPRNLIPILLCTLFLAHPPTAFLPPLFTAFLSPVSLHMVFLPFLALTETWHFPAHHFSCRGSLFSHILFLPPLSFVSGLKGKNNCSPDFSVLFAKHSFSIFKCEFPL